MLLKEHHYLYTILRWLSFYHGVSLKTPRPRGWVCAEGHPPVKCPSSGGTCTIIPMNVGCSYWLPRQHRVKSWSLWKWLQFVQLTAESCWGQQSNPCKHGKTDFKPMMMMMMTPVYLLNLSQSTSHIPSHFLFPLLLIIILSFYCFFCDIYFYCFYSHIIYLKLLLAPVFLFFYFSHHAYFFIILSSSFR